MKHRKKVMMIAQRMVGGDSEHIKVLGAELQTLGWDVTVVANWRPGHSVVPRSFFRDAGMATSSIDFPQVRGHHQFGIEAFRAASALSQLIRFEQPDVVHAHARSILPYCMATSAAPIIFTKHLTGATDWISNVSYGLPDRVIAISSELYDEMLTSSHLRADRVRPITHGIDPLYANTPQGEKASVRKMLGLPARDLILLSVGRLDSQKDHSLTLRALNQMRTHVPAVHLVIVGDGPRHGELVRQIESLSLENVVTLAGAKSPLSYLDAADIFVLSSRYEGFALVVPEAMMRSLPVIRTQTGGAKDQVVPGVTGLLFNPGDVSALAAGLSLLADDPALRSRMGKAAKSRAQRMFTSREMAEKTDQVYREAIARTTRGLRTRRRTGTGAINAMIAKAEKIAKLTIGGSNRTPQSEHRRPETRLWNNLLHMATESSRTSGAPTVTPRCAIRKSNQRSGLAYSRY